MVFGIKIPKITTETVAFKGTDPVRSKIVINYSVIIIIVTKNIRIKLARRVAAMNNWMPKIMLNYRPY
jgi:hypothetical protein